MTTFLVAHGAWSSAFAWKRMHPLMRARGHELIVPSLTGLGDRFHLASASIDLEMHIRDLQQVMFHEDLRDLVLVGHSYGGMVATGVADREAARIRKLVYVDAFAPRDGQSLLDLLHPAMREQMLEVSASQGDGWRVPATPLPPDTPADDVAWITPRRHAQPVETVRQKLRLLNGGPRSPCHYVYCLKPMPGDPFRQFAQRAKAEGWGYDELDSTHNPHLTIPGVYAELLDRIAAA